MSRHSPAGMYGSTTAIVIVGLNVTLLLGACCQAKPSISPFGVLQLQGTDSGYELGAVIGKATKLMIQQRFAASTGLHQCLKYAATPEGNHMVHRMLKLHNDSFPGYIQELKGFAAGAEIPFFQVLVANMCEELMAAAGLLDERQGDSCTDVLLALPADAERLVRCHSINTTGQTAANTPADCVSAHQAPATTLVGHNEDMTPDTTGRVFFIKRLAGSKAHRSTRSRTDSTQGSADAAVELALHPAIAKAPQSISWLAFVYAGELASSGFGFNSAGIGFTLNAVFPAKAAVPGISRNFVSRQLLQAGSIDEALAVIGQHRQAVGHSYNLMDLGSKRLLNVEVGPAGHTSVIEVQRNDGSWYFHANMYKHLVVRQSTNASSYHREARALQLQAPSNVTELLAVLGDTADKDYPIYRHAASHKDKSVVTLCTALIDVEQGTLNVWTGNPAVANNRTLVLHADLHTLETFSWPLLKAAHRWQDAQTVTV